ncbi:cytoplasmic protein [Mycena pura]|uniref:Cytoplasmic protein n=1 Tax=Mycena pura TaxID=153505 RepID=A0AAD6VH36_9AGAR|nr:cytoplasmic protein [Mycena pura]
MSLVNVLTSLVNLLCGGSQSAPQQQQQAPQKPQQQAPQPLEQPQQHYERLQPQQQHEPTQHTHTPSPPHRPERPQHGYSDPNQANQHDPTYMALRAQANEEGDQMARCFAESHEAYERGDGAAAKQLSNQGKSHQAKMNSLNKQASDWIFVENNKDSKPREIDLHGLYTKEAIERTDRALEEAKQRGDTELHLIVGKGLHSQGHAKIKPAIEELMQKWASRGPVRHVVDPFLCRHRLAADLDPHNAGVLIVHIGSDQGTVGPDDIARRLQREDEGCTIM